MEGDTPLHSAARLSAQRIDAEEDAKAVVEMLLEAGADPRYSSPPLCQETDVENTE